MKATIGISKRHVHLTAEIFDKLFGNIEFKVRNNLNQPGEFASELTVDVKSNDKVLERVRVVGPLRKYNQVEVSKSDAKFLGINPPVRKSGKVEGSSPITLIGPEGEVSLDEGAIIAQRHIHMDSEKALELGLVDEDRIMILKDGQELYDAFVKIVDPAYFEIHIDNEEAALYNLNNGDEVDFVKCGE